MKILLTGGTGFIGTSLLSLLDKKEHEIIILSRYPKKIPKTYSAISSLEDLSSAEKIDGIINLAGAPINKRWSETYKKTLLESRLKTTRNLVDLIRRLRKKPSFLISGSAIGYYGPQPDHEKITEETPFQDSFAHQLCDSWEKEALNAEEQGIRVCLMRLGVVLGGDGGVLSQLYWPYKFFMGGKIGSGNQGFSWIHIEDLCNAILFLIQNRPAKGIYNLTAPDPLSQYHFSKELGRILRRPTYAFMPAFVVKLLFGQMGKELLLQGANVYPNRLLDLGFSFKYPNVGKALKSIYPKDKK